MEAPRDVYEKIPLQTACLRHPHSSYCTLIRLVSIAAGSPSDPLNCTLSQDCVPWGYPFPVPEGQQTNYEALSYVWGDASVKSSIFLQGYPFEVTLNLNAALRHLRLETRSRVLWIDAICINQANLEERNQQVQAMTSIYQTAQRVVVWLGESGDGSDKAFDHLNKKASELRPPPTQTQDRHVDGWQEYFDATIDPHVSVATWISPEEIALLSRPWWTRIWVVQEVAVAQDVLIQCGKSTISWAILGQAYGSPTAISSLFNNKSEQKLPKLFQKLDIIRWIRNRGRDIQLLDLMDGFRYCQATDPRDKCIALMGLIPPSNDSDERLDPDYTIPYEEMYIRTARFLITVTGSLDVLSYCDPRYDETDISNLMGDAIFEELSSRSSAVLLPSWVPDWSQTVPTSALHLRNSCSVQINRRTSSTDDSPIYRACGNKRLRLRQSSDKGSLVLTGILFDRIKECCGRPSYLFHEKHNRDPIYDWVRFVKGLRDFVDGKRATESDVKALDLWVLRRQGLGVDDLGDRIKFSGSITDAVSDAWNGRRFFISEKGYIGLAPLTARAGDAVCVLFGGQVPFILRERHDYGHSMVGECYVHGIMDGEAIERNPNKRATVEFILR